MKVAEKFISINGEGPCAGELAAFIRFKGCNISCSYCDTAWANVADCPYEEMTPEKIVSYIADSGVANVTLTGGEPLLQNEMPALLKLLSERGCGRGDLQKEGGPKSNLTTKELHLHKCKLRVEIETNGSIDISPFCKRYRPVFTMDYKLPSSGCEDKMLTGNFDYLHKDDTVKFVCGSQEDLKRAYEIIKEHELIGKCNIYLSPVFGRIEPSRMVEFMVHRKLNGVRLQIQMHKVIWNPEARGV